MRVVLDTNVLVSAFVWRKGLKPIYQAVRYKDTTPCFTDETFAELKKVLLYPQLREQLLRAHIAPEEITRLLFNRSYFVPSIIPVQIITADPSDNAFLASPLPRGLILL